MKSESFFYHIHKNPSLDPILNQMKESTFTHPTPLASILLLSFHLHLDLPSGIFHSGFRTNLHYKRNCYMQRKNYRLSVHEPLQLSG